MFSTVINNSFHRIKWNFVNTFAYVLAGSILGGKQKLKVEISHFELNCYLLRLLLSTRDLRQLFGTFLFQRGLYMQRHMIDPHTQRSIFDRTITNHGKQRESIIISCAVMIWGVAKAEEENKLHPPTNRLSFERLSLSVGPWCVALYILWVIFAF